MLAPHSRPLLPGSARIELAERGVRVTLRDVDYAIDTPFATASALLRDCGGVHTLVDLATQTGLSVAQVAEHLDPLAAEGSLYDTARTDLDDADAFVDAYLDLCDLWVQDIFSRPFWRVMLEGHASAGLVLGWGVEFQHFVAAANEYMAAGVAHARDTVEQRWLAEHYVEEYAHAAIFQDGLVADGLDRVRVQQSRPLATTRALTNYLHEIALADTLAYAGTFALMQAPRRERTLANIGALYEDLTRAYPFAAGLLGAFRKHVEVDVALAHDELAIAKILHRRGRIRGDQRQRILRASWGLTEHFILFFDGIFDAYGGLPAPVLRPAPDIRLYLRP